MNSKIKLLHLSFLLAISSPAMAITSSSVSQVSANTESQIQHSDTWQPLPFEVADTSAVGSKGVAVQAIPVATAAQAVHTAPTQAIPATTAVQAANPAPPQAAPQVVAQVPDQNKNAVAPAAKAKLSNSPSTDADDAFMNDAIKRNQVLSELEYERARLTLQQDISQLQLSIKKNQTELDTATANDANANNNGQQIYTSANNNALTSAGDPQVIEIFIKQGQAQATLYYGGMQLSVTVGKKFGSYTVKAIDKNTVTLTKLKQAKPIILSLLNS